MIFFAYNWPIKRPISGGKLEVVKDMLAHGAAVNATGPHGTTALHWAACEDRVEVAIALIDAGARVNSRAADGATPLHYAAREDSVDLVALLLKNGADPSVADNNGRRPIDLIYDETTGEGAGIAHLLKKFGSLPARELEPMPPPWRWGDPPIASSGPSSSSSTSLNNNNNNNGTSSTHVHSERTVSSASGNSREVLVTLGPDGKLSDFDYQRIRSAYLGKGIWRPDEGVHSASKGGNKASASGGVGGSEGFHIEERATMDLRALSLMDPPTFDEDEDEEPMRPRPETKDTGVGDD
jgi:hypothetical protein